MGPPQETFMRLASFLPSSLSALLSGGIGLGLLLSLSAMSACTDNGDADTVTPDGGKKPNGKDAAGDDDDDDDDVDPTGDGGAEAGPPATITTTAIKTGPSQLVGITTGSTPHVVYVAVVNQQLSLEAVPVAGGSPTVLATLTPDDDFGVTGGVVYWFTGLDEDGIGDLSIWTKAGGTKAKVAKSFVGGTTYGSEDGSRVAFAVNVAGISFDLAVTGTASPSASPVLTGNDTIDVPSDDCLPDIGFAGNTLFAAFCTSQTAGTANSSAARLYAIGPAGAAKRLDAKGTVAANVVRLSATTSLWFADKTGSKVFFIGSGTDSQGRLVDVASATVTPLENNVIGGFMLPDGSSAVYATAQAVKKSGATPTVLATTPVRRLAALGSNGKRVFFSSLPAGAGGLSDLRSLDTAAAGAPADLVATATGLFSGILGGGDFVMYRTGVDPTGKGTLASKPAAGGNEVVLSTSAYGAIGIPSTTGVLVATKVDTTPAEVPFATLEYLDGATGGTPTTVSTDALVNAWAVSGKTFVFTRIGTEAGVYAAALP